MNKSSHISHILFSKVIQKANPIHGSMRPGPNDCFLFGNIQIPIRWLEEHRNVRLKAIPDIINLLNFRLRFGFGASNVSR